MRKTNLAFLAILALSTVAYANEQSKDAVQNSVERSTTHNPLTNSTTSTVVRKHKRDHRSKDGRVDSSEDTLKNQYKRSDDGHKSSSTTEEVHTNEQK